MVYRLLKSLLLIWFILPSMSFAAMPCADPDILALTDRGSITDTPGVIPHHKILIEGASQYASLSQGGPLVNFPQLQINVGLPLESNLIFQFPNYFKYKSPDVAGLTSAGLGLKHEFFYGDQWIISGSGVIYPEGGSVNFGNNAASYIFNVLALYSITPQLNVMTMLGSGTFVEPRVFGGRQFNSFNPSFSVSFAPKEFVSVFAEVFGQTKTSYDEGSGFMVNGGVVYVLNKNTAIDFEAGQLVQGNFLSINHFFTLGLTLLLS